MKNTKILVIDDESAILAVVKVALENLGNWEVSTASRGNEGLAQAKSQIFAVILLDVMMPDVNGWEVLQKLQTYPTTQDTSIILLTGKGSELNEVDYHSLNVAGIIPKPFAPLELAQKIAEILSLN